MDLSSGWGYLEKVSPSLPKPYLFFGKSEATYLLPTSPFKAMEKTHMLYNK